MTSHIEKTAPLVLIVNHVEANRFLYASILKDAGYEVAEADSGVQSLLKLEPRPDVILLDINLPDINGYEICRQLKKSHLKNIRVIQTSSGFITENDTLKGLHSGADACVTSPVDARALVQSVKRCLEKEKLV